MVPDNTMGMTVHHRVRVTPATRSAVPGQLVVIMMHPTLPVMHDPAAILPVRMTVHTLVSAITLTVPVKVH